LPDRKWAIANRPGCVYNNFMKKPAVAQKSPYVLPMQPGTFFFCACGLSQGQPFCDDSHKGSGFVPKKVDITEARTVAWCGCKHSGNGGFCDGSHAKLP
jgi:CDGSH iron-sulfur domain-containing protein 3